VRTLLLAPRLRFRAHDIVKPDGSLALPYLAGGLREAGLPVDIVDCTVGTDADDLATTFYRRRDVGHGMIEVGVSDDRLAELVCGYDVIGITSIFTMQTTAILAMLAVIREANPRALIVMGGVNARSLPERFFAAGVDAIHVGEADRSMRHLTYHGADYSIPGPIRNAGWLERVTFDDRPHYFTPAIVTQDLDELPMPAWDLMPNARYWQISRPHGGDFAPGETIRYASLMTSRGCPFVCKYCHISKEGADSPSGAIGAYRVKSRPRVRAELANLKTLGVEWVFVEDDSLLAKKKRALELMDDFAATGLRFADVNGVNLAHLVIREGPGYGVDRGLLRALRQAGFEKLTLPFESGSQRILDRYASRKWRTDVVPHARLVEVCREEGITPLGNYTIGYPDETLDEMLATVRMAKDHVRAGLAVASFFCIVPFPGTQLFDDTLASGALAADWSPDTMNWTMASWAHSTVPADTINAVRRVAWELVNDDAFTASRKAMAEVAA
jgi:anaerobic magnesium-protoporphyrin IX monomethyl ester cyclase